MDTRTAATMVDPETDADAAARVFASAAELFAVLATPLRLRIINAICQGERPVGEIVGMVESTQPNVSQHLKVLYMAGIVGRRRDGNQIYYGVRDQRAVDLCRAVCNSFAAGDDV